MKLILIAVAVSIFGCGTGTIHTYRTYKTEPAVAPAASNSEAKKNQASSPTAASVADQQDRRVKEEFGRFVGEPSRCYREVSYRQNSKVVGAVKMNVTLEISVGGVVQAVIVDFLPSGKITKLLAEQISSCIRKGFADLSFSGIAAATTYTYPYLFQRTEGAGPAETCYNLRGCPGQ